MEDTGCARACRGSFCCKEVRLLTRVALDTNVLVAIFRDDSLGQEIARVAAAEIQAGSTLHIPVSCIAEFWRVTTEPRGLGADVDEVQLFLRRSTRLFPTLFPRPGYLKRLLGVAAELRPVGATIFDVQIAVVCLQHSMDELWTMDSRFPALGGLSIVDPMSRAT